MLNTNSEHSHQPHVKIRMNQKYEIHLIFLLIDIQFDFGKFLGMLKQMCINEMIIQSIFDIENLPI